MFSERYAVRKPDIYKVRTADPSCLCIFRYVKLRVYKHLLKIKLWGFCTSLTSLMSILSLFLPLTPSRLQADLWKTEALCVRFSARASKTHARGSPRWGTLCYSSGRLWPTRTEQVYCLETLLAILCKPRNISLILSSNFLMAVLPPSIILSL